MMFSKITFIKLIFMSIFSKIKVPRPKRTVHNMSYSSKLSLPFGRLVPIMCEKVVPGDKFVHSHEFLLRFAPFIGQVFQSFQTRVDYFFVPSRLLWDNFEKFLVEDDATVYPHPYFELGDLLDGDSDMTGTLVDYFNLPTVNRTSVSPYFSILDGTGTNINVDALPLAAYVKIFLDYYADENLLTLVSAGGNYDFNAICDLFQDICSYNGNDFGSRLATFIKAINFGRTSFTDEDSLRLSLMPFQRAYPKDYFTSALPWAQRGPLVQIPLNGSGDVVAYSDNAGGRINYQGISVEFEGTPAGGSEVELTLRRYGKIGLGGTLTPQLNLDGSTPQLSRYAVPYLSGSDTEAQANEIKESPVISFRAVNVNGTATITDLRTAMAVQSWLEKNARAGVRYKEQLLSHFGVRSRDYRLDRAQLLQSSKSTVSIGEVFTTAANDDGTFMPGLGVSTATGSQAVRPFKRFFDEHGYVIGLMTVYPAASYYQGIPKQFLELDKFDYYWPEFQHIGEQEIKSCELFVDDETSANNDKTFGYTPRYAHYKNRTNQVHGDFRTSLMYMHDGRSFINRPLLNKSFIDIDVAKNNLYRVFNYTEESPFYNAYPCYCDFFHNFKAIRPMSYFGTPRIV